MDRKDKLRYVLSFCKLLQTRGLLRYFVFCVNSFGFNLLAISAQKLSTLFSGLRDTPPGSRSLALPSRANTTRPAYRLNDRELFLMGWVRMGHLACKHLGNIPDFAWEAAAASAKVARRRGRLGGGAGRDVPPRSPSPRLRRFRAHFGPRDSGGPESSEARTASAGLVKIGDLLIIFD